jgi:hypothetical protein
MPWNQATRRTRRLIVRIGATASGSPWRAVVRESIQEFNALSRRHNLGVTLDLQAGSTGACDALIEIGSGTISCQFGGRARTEAFRGDITHGRTLVFQRSGLIEKAFVFLPANPMASATRAGGGRAPVGPPVKKYIAVHELIHACGPTDDDHSVNDIFHRNPDVLGASRPADDRVTFLRGGQLVRMPPIEMMPGTISCIRALWV